MKLVVLLPPSQTKADDGTGEALADIHPVTRELLHELVDADPNDVYTARHEEAALLNKNALSAPTMPAIERYTGTVYKALDYDSLENKRWVDEHVRIISPLFGLLEARDEIPNYKFTIRKLQAYKRWKPHNTKELRDCYVVDLLSRSYQKSVEYAHGEEITFTRTKNGKTVKAGHAGKTIKGKYVRWLAHNDITDPKDLHEFSADGYRWNGESFHQE